MLTPEQIETSRADFEKYIANRTGSSMNKAYAAGLFEKYNEAYVCSPLQYAWEAWKFQQAKLEECKLLALKNATNNESAARAENAFLKNALQTIRILAQGGISGQQPIEVLTAIRDLTNRSFL